MTDQTTETAITRITTYLDTRDADLAHIPHIGPGVIDTWPRTDNDADGQFELTATDLRTALKRIADLELVPRCGAMTPSAFINAEPLGPCILNHGHGGMHQESSRGIPPIHGARWTDHNDPLAVEHARNAELAERAEQTIANSAEIITARDKRIRELEAERPTDGDEARYTEWATRTPDGTRTSWDAEWKARRFARHHPHLKVDSREIRHYVGHWHEVTPHTSEPVCGNHFRGSNCLEPPGHDGWHRDYRGWAWTPHPSDAGESGDETRPA